MRSIDWSKTAVGPIEGWPQSLKTALSILLETGFPMYIAWGPGFTQFYNDGYRPILGSTKHPAAMGISTRQTFAEIWHIIGPMFEGVMQGRATTVVDFLLPLDRHGFVEECYFIFSYSPIREEGGRVGGVLVTVTETTQRVIGERRLKTSQALAARTREARTVREACAIAGAVLDENPADVPAALIYLVNDAARQAVLVAATGDAAALDERAEAVSLSEGAGPYAVAEVIRSGVPVLRPPSNEAAPATERGARAAPGSIAVLPIGEPGAGRAAGALVARTSGRLLMDAAYVDFLSLVASQIGGAIAGARALEEAKARAEALAELDRAKTAFFSNVSHEFRTPLTLMLGPTQDALASPERALRGDDLETVHRNELRLLKLVNTLLDFSRIEAGRATARFEMTDLSALTADLASAFRSAVERAGLELRVNCPPLPEPVYVDREMWEKVVLNLLSNAFKFTMAGSIEVALEWRGHEVELRVADTGVGIATEDLERVFDRFHRSARVKARTHEGSGIGLALVREIVGMHGGTVRASSAPGQGATFTVKIPTGCAHLAPERVGATRELASSTTGARPYVEEALRWLPPDPTAAASARARSGATPDARVLVADDNADMRDYLTRLVAPRWQVQTAGDGRAALDAARTFRPDVIVADVMMPEMDGFQLLAALRSGEDTRSIPVILLSARAGEESRIDGLQAGADDYLVKPFSARELVARIEAQLERARVRSLEEAHAIRLANVFEHAPVGIAFLRGPKHVFEFANRQYVQLVGGRPVAGKPIRDALPELEGQGIYELLDHVYTSGDPHVGRSVRMELAGTAGLEERFFDFVYQPLFDDTGAVTGIAVVAFDVTELTMARRAAEQANRAKDEFLAMLGHELRNPLAPILTALQLMRLRGVAGADRERAVIERQVRHVVSLVDDLLDVSRITRGKVQLRRQPVDLADVVAKAIEMTSPAIEERHHVLRVDVPKGIVVDADPGRLAQVVANLLANAAKYTDAGGRILVRGGVDDDNAALNVIDNGVGIEPEMLPRIFDLFSQGRQDIDRSQGGLGLGLAIVSSLVQAHGGRVSAHSAGKGTGAEFSIAIPLARGAVRPEAAAPVSPAEALAARELRVLVVDDNADAAELLAESLRALGYTTRVAFDGPTALEAARSFQPDVAVLDLGLPVMDGFEVAERLRADPALASVQLAAITGYGQEVDRQRTRASGFGAHLVKPVDVEHLHAWLRSVRTRPVAANDGAADPDARTSA